MKRLDIFPHVSGQRCAGAPSRPHNHHATGWFIPFQYYFAMPSVCVCVSECVGLGEGDVWKWNDWAVGLDCGHWDAGFDHWTIEASSSHVSISGVIWVMNFGRVTKYNIQRRTGISAFSGISNEWRTQHDPTRWSHFHCLLYIFFFFLLYFILLGFFIWIWIFWFLLLLLLLALALGLFTLKFKGKSASLIYSFVLFSFSFFVCVSDDDDDDDDEFVSLDDFSGCLVVVLGGTSLASDLEVNVEWQSAGRNFFR